MAEKIKSYGAGVLFVVFIGVLIWFAGSLNGSQTYDVKPEISIPQYQSDAARAIDAYEKVMDRYMDISESNFKNIESDNEKIFEKLLEIQTDIARIDARLERIEKAMGLDPLPPVCTKVPPQGPAEKPVPKKAPPAEERM
ncbi:MAG: hypothetical protein PHP01_00345 [Phycisphaerae bacterium]|nr:hypothetical protein [Phycisphaerae bacterium]